MSADNSQFDFIVNPDKQQRKKIPLIGGGGKLAKIVIGLVALLVVFIIFVVVKGIVVGPSNLTLISNVVARQEELLHYTVSSKSSNIIAANTKSAIVTADLALKSEQAALIGYLGTQQYEITPEEIGRFSTASNDALLKRAKETSTYEVELRKILDAKFDGYLLALSEAYDNTDGAKGKELLKKSYDSAQLLEKQLAKR